VSPALPGRAQHKRLLASHEFIRLHLVMADMRVGGFFWLLLLHGGEPSMGLVNANDNN
jgi:hypothetical protein